MNGRAVPMLHVPDVAATVEWYRGIGFEVRETFGDGRGGLSFAILALGPSEVMLTSGGRGREGGRRDASLYVYTDRIDALHLQLTDRVEVVEPPHETFYLMRELVVSDPNGFRVTFGEPIAAEGPRVAGTADVAELERFTGLYTSDQGLSVKITIGDGSLVAFPDESHPVRLAAVARLTFAPIGLADASVTFAETAGTITGLSFTQNSRTLRFERSDDGR